MKRRTFLATTTKATLGAMALANTRLRAEMEPNWQIGIFTRPWAEQDYPVALDAIAQAGYQYCGLMTEKNGLVVDVNTTEKKARAIGAAAEQRGLTILSVYGGDFGANKSLEAAVNGLKKLIDNMVACGSRTVLLGGTGRENEVENYYNAVKACCDYARQQNVIMTLKPHGGLNATGPQCRATIEKVKHPNFQLCYDPGNIFYYSDGQLDPTVDVETVGNIVKGMCVKDFRLPKEVDVTPGTGMVNFPLLFEKLKGRGFAGGPLVIECLAKGDVKQTIEEAIKAKAYLENILA